MNFFKLGMLARRTGTVAPYDVKVVSGYTSLLDARFMNYGVVVTIIVDGEEHIVKHNRSNLTKQQADATLKRVLTASVFDAGKWYRI